MNSLVVLALCLPAIMGMVPVVPGGNYQQGSYTPYFRGPYPFYRYPSYPLYNYPTYPNTFPTVTGQCTRRGQQCVPGVSVCCPGATCRSSQFSPNFLVCQRSFAFDEANPTAADAAADVAAAGDVGR